MKNLVIILFSLISVSVYSQTLTSIPTTVTEIGDLGNNGVFLGDWASEGHPGSGAPPYFDQPIRPDVDFAFMCQLQIRDHRQGFNGQDPASKYIEMAVSNFEISDSQYVIGTNDLSFQYVRWYGPDTNFTEIPTSDLPINNHYFALIPQFIDGKMMLNGALTMSVPLDGYTLTFTERQTIATDAEQIMISALSQISHAELAAPRYELRVVCTQK